jgi:hypothetical protein
MFAKIENGKVKSITIGDTSLCNGEILLPDNIDINDIEIFANIGFFDKNISKNCINIANPSENFELFEI